MPMDAQAKLVQRTPCAMCGRSLRQRLCINNRARRSPGDGRTLIIGCSANSGMRAAPPYGRVPGEGGLDTVIESTTLRCMYELRTEHDLSHQPRQIDIGSAASLLAALTFR